MDVFEYLPQLMVAYDGVDEFANLIHAQKADKNKEYFCPCCGGVVKLSTLDDDKRQSYFQHIIGACAKENQLSFFCRNWLFGCKSKFYLNGKLFEVASVDIGKTWATKFGDYKPDITVYTTFGSVIYFEMFFSNRKAGDDYFCKWDALGNDVVEVNIKECMSKTSKDIRPTFEYLYHDGVCYSKSYVKKDLYANTIAKRKQKLVHQDVFNYKDRIEQLDLFWREIRENKSKDCILKTVAAMSYEDLDLCYEIVKKKYSVSYLKDDILNIIKQSTIKEIRNALKLPYDENVYFDLVHTGGKTYEAGIRLNVKTNHIIFDGIYIRCEYCNSLYNQIAINKKKNDLSIIIIPEDKKEELYSVFEETVRYKEQLFKFEEELSALEGNDYKVRFKNGYYTVLAKIHGNDFEPLLNDYYMDELSVKSLLDRIEYEIKKIKDLEYLSTHIQSDECKSIISELQNYKRMNFKVNIHYENFISEEKQSGVYFRLLFGGKCIYEKMLMPSIKDFVDTVNECKIKIENFISDHNAIINLVSRINSCKNGLWGAEYTVSHLGLHKIKIFQKFVPKIQCLTYECIEISDLANEEEIINSVEEKMNQVLKNMESYGYRIMEECA